VTSGGVLSATRVCLALAAALAAVGPLAASSREPRDPADALAFVRVIADVRVDFGGVRPPIEREGLELATGSGFVAAPSGLVLTSHHVVAEGDPEEAFPAPEGSRVRIENRRIEVVIGDEGSRRVLDGWVAAADPELDLAALQVTASDLPYLPMGDSDAAEAGRPVQVLGFPFGRKVEVARRGDAMPKATVTAGSVSAARENEEGDRRYLQTDATVNPGSSGGPMLDEDGYVVGLVRMKLSKGATGSGPGFAVTVNVVKDFLEAHGLLTQLPVGRLRPGVVQTFDWKAVRLEAPDGFADSATSRLRVDLGEIEGIDGRVFRLPTSLPAEELEQALVRAGEVPGFAPAPATARSGGVVVRRGGVPLRLGGAEGETDDHRPFRIEYALLALKDEAVVARYLGHPDAVAFNLGLVRHSLRSLEAASMRPVPTASSVAASWDLPNPAFTSATFPNGEGARLAVPVDWSVEPADPETAWRACLGPPPTGGGLAVRHPAAYAVVLRAWRTDPSAIPGDKGLGTCRASSRRFQRLGVVYQIAETVVRRRGAAARGRGPGCGLAAARRRPRALGRRGRPGVPQRALTHGHGPWPPHSPTS
jgi:S1-C subfamily serine protease